jgi:hypothetical protein
VLLAGVPCLLTNTRRETKGRSSLGKRHEARHLPRRKLGRQGDGRHVSEPFHWFEPNMVTGAEEAYAEGVGAISGKALGAVTDAARRAGISLKSFMSRRSILTKPSSMPQRAKLRPDRDGLARSERYVGACSRQRDGQGPHTMRNSDAGLPLSAPRRAGRRRHRGECSQDLPLQATIMPQYRQE